MTDNDVAMEDPFLGFPRENKSNISKLFPEINVQLALGSVSVLCFGLALQQHVRSLQEEPEPYTPNMHKPLDEIGQGDETLSISFGLGVILAAIFMGHRYFAPEKMLDQQDPTSSSTLEEADEDDGKEDISSILNDSFDGYDLCQIDAQHGYEVYETSEKNNGDNASGNGVSSLSLDLEEAALFGDMDSEYLRRNGGDVEERSYSPLSLLPDVPSTDKTPTKVGDNAGENERDSMRKAREKIQEGWSGDTFNETLSVMMTGMFSPVSRKRIENEMNEASKADGCTPSDPSFLSRLESEVDDYSSMIDEEPLNADMKR